MEDNVKAYNKGMAGTSIIVTVIFILLQNPFIFSNPYLFVLTNPSVLLYLNIKSNLKGLSPRK